MKNYEIAWILLEYADLLDLTGENPFKARAYRRAARQLEQLSQPVTELNRQGRLTEINGVGSTISNQIAELLATGSIAAMESLKKQVPSGLFTVLTVPGVGPIRAHLFYQELGITSLAELEEAARKRQLRKLKGIGNKVEATILDGIRRLTYPQFSQRLPLALADEYADLLISRLNLTPEVVEVAVAGSLRRRVETVGDLDLLVATQAPEDVGAFFRSFPEFTKILTAGLTKISAYHRGGFQVDLQMVLPNQFPAALAHFTGSKEHNIRLRQLAKAKNYRLNEYGFQNLKAEGSDFLPTSEAELFNFIELPFIEPELREDRGEIEAAQAGELPQLITVTDIQGDLHIHSRWSDGLATIEEIARAAAARGYSYIAICDHSQSLSIAKGLTFQRLQAQRQEIANLNQHGDLGIFILSGIEVDILNDQLDFPDAVLAEADVVVASIHSGFKQPPETIMSRIELALRNPHVDILAHPTGRLLGRRAGYAIDLDRIIDLAVETQTALEINAFPDRLDLDDRSTRQALERGAMVVINSDSHRLEHLDNMRYGVSVARRAWAEPHQILNCRNLQGLREWLTSR